jgi:alkanesulfonate monooxygenase SsuD/methylene tetrahydromethanopterin reductase-like flavin-dependent oxidoreductase (luciferase family)
MQIDVGLDATDLTDDDSVQVVTDAARFGYGRIWIGSIGDPFQTCALRWAASRSAVPGGIGTAIGVVPAGQDTPVSLAIRAAGLSRLTGGRFILGIGAGSSYQAAYRRAWGISERSPLALVRAYLTTVRGFLAGESVTWDGSGISYEAARLPESALPGEGARTPVYLGAAGPQMVRLGGELADGIYLSWCTSANVRQTRGLIAEGAERAGRDPAAVTLAASFRVCVDDDTDVARRALASALLPYVLGWGGEPPRAFRSGFERMGFAAEIAELDELRARGADREQILEAFPERMLRALGYFGPAAGAADAVRRQVADADIAVIRIVASGQGAEPIQRVIRACAPLAV